MPDVSSRFRELTREVPIPYPWDITAFVAAVAEHRGRPIHLRQVDPAALVGNGCGTNSGLWIALEHADLILYAAETDWHAEYIITHETGHMLLKHDDDSASADVTREDIPMQTLHELMPSLSTSAIKSVLGRSDYSLAREQEAETFADLVMAEATLPRRKPSTLRSTFFRARHR